jgi:hypothetical protein
LEVGSLGQWQNVWYVSLNFGTLESICMAPAHDQELKDWCMTIAMLWDTKLIRISHHEWDILSADYLLTWYHLLTICFCWLKSVAFLTIFFCIFVLPLWSTAINFEWIKMSKIMYGLWVCGVKTWVWDQCVSAEANLCANSLKKIEPHLKISQILTLNFQSNCICFACLLQHQHLGAVEHDSMESIQALLEHAFKTCLFLFQLLTMDVIWSLIRD